jgi:hypothetical protein
VQLGHDVETIIGSAYPSFGFGGRNSAGLLLVNFGFCIFNQQQFRADSWSIPQLPQSLDRLCHPIEHPTHIHASMTLPTRPNAIFSTLQGTQNPDTKPTLQRAKNANAQPTHPG